MILKEAKTIKEGETIYYGSCPVRFVRLEQLGGYWFVIVFVIVNDEKGNDYEDKLLLSSVSKKEGEVK